MAQPDRRRPHDSVLKVSGDINSIGMGYLPAIAKTRHQILADNEEPRDILISVAIKHALLDELGLFYRRDGAVDETLMGMKVEWTKAKPLTEPQIVIRTAKGDSRIVNLLSGDERIGK